MAVTISVEALLAALRLGTTDAETAQATRLLAYATEAVQKHSPGAPENVQNEAVVRLSGYLFDSPPASRGAAYANALRNSGAAAILSPYRIHRAGSVQGAVAAAGAPAPGPAPAPADPSGTGIDQVARAAAGRAQAAADRAQAAADEADVDQAARDAAAANAAAIAALPEPTPHVDQTARDAAAAAQATADEGDSGTPLDVVTEEIAKVSFSDAMSVVEFEAANVAVDTGIPVPASTKTIFVNYGAATDALTAGLDLPWFAIPIEEWNRLDGVDAGDGPTAATFRFTRTWRDPDITSVGATAARQVWLAKGNNGNLFVLTDNVAWDIHPFRARFEIHVPLNVVTEVTGEVVVGSTVDQTARDAIAVNAAAIAALLEGGG